mmetsp:Transcript_88982/g.288179  ORF Transcript_88982/g.288179 Transcript_88982/m.288179 type:complete len:214 (-) Transcript_88982:345-986(-)
MARAGSGVVVRTRGVRVLEASLLLSGTRTFSGVNGSADGARRSCTATIVFLLLANTCAGSRERSSADGDWSRKGLTAESLVQHPQAGHGSQGTNSPDCCRSVRGAVTLPPSRDCTGAMRAACTRCGGGRGVAPIPALALAPSGERETLGVSARRGVPRGAVAFVAADARADSTTGLGAGVVGRRLAVALGVSATQSWLRERERCGSARGVAAS